MSNLKLRINFVVSDESGPVGYFSTREVDIRPESPSLQVFLNRDYDRKKWEDFLVYDISQDLRHHASEYVGKLVPEILDKCESFAKKKIKNN